MKKHNETGISIFENYEEQRSFFEQKENYGSVIIIPEEGENSVFILTRVVENGVPKPMGIVENGELSKMKEYILKYFPDKSNIPPIFVSHTLKNQFV